MVKMVEILDGRLGQRSVERVRYVINNLLHLVIVKYGDISLVLCISTRPRLVTILSLLVKYLVILLEKWFPLQGERGHSFYFRCFQKQNREEGRQNKNNRPINLPNVITFSRLQVHHPILTFIIDNKYIIIYIHTYIHTYIFCSSQLLLMIFFKLK